MTGLYDSIAATESGARALAAARLRYDALAVLHDALKRTGFSAFALAERLGYRDQAVMRVLDGLEELTIFGLAEYLHALGYEVDLVLRPSGWQRERAVRQVRDRDEEEVS